jgi:hypothetical protein
MVVFLAVCAAAVTQSAHADFSLNSASNGAPTVDMPTVDVPTPKPVADVDNTIPINEIEAALKDDQKGDGARLDVMGRLLDFMNEKDADGKSFVGADVDHAALAATVKDWVVKKEKNEPGSLATLYFAMGPGKVRPKWVEISKSLQNTFTSDMMWKGCLRENLAAFTDPNSSQITASSEKTQITSFLNKALTVVQGDEKDATAPNKDIFTTCKTKEDADASRERRGYKNLNPMPRMSHSKVLNPSGISGGKASYSLDDMFVQGAVVREVFKDSDKGWRRISTKIYTKREKDGTLTNEIGIFDITDPNNIFGHRYPFTTSGKIDVTLGAPGNYEYSLHVRTDKEGRSQIDFVRRGEEPSELGKEEKPGQLTTSIEKLLLKRADQAQALGSVVTVGGEDFYVVPQGGAKGALVMLPKAAVDNRSIDTARASLRPQLFAEIVQRGPEGNAVNIKYEKGAMLGRVNGDDYHLAYNEKAKLWEIKDGEGDKPKIEEAPENEDGKGDKHHKGDGGGNKADPGIEAVEKTLRDAKGANCSPKEKSDTEDLDDNLKGKYGVVTCGKGTKTLFVLVPQSVRPNGQYEYAGLADFNRGWLYRHYVVFAYKKATNYKDLLKAGPNGLADAGTVTMNEKGSGFSARGFSDADLLIDAIEIHTNMPANVADKLRERVLPRVKARVGAKPYAIEATVNPERIYIVVEVDGVRYEVLPRDVVATSDKDLYARGPDGTANGFTGAPDAEFPEKFLVDGTREATLVDKQADIALYHSVPTKKSDNNEEKHYLMLKYKAKTDDSFKILRTHFEIYSTGKDGRPKPAELEMAGLQAVGAVLKEHTSAGWSFVPGSDDTRGVLVITQNRNVSGENVSDKRANCAGPVLWWGIEGGRDEAQKICEADGF